MPGNERDYYEGVDAIQMGGPRGRSGLTLDAVNALYPDLIRVPKGAYVLAVLPTTAACWLLEEGVDADTSLSSALARTNGLKALPDSWATIPVEPGSYVAVYSETAGTEYALGFYERAPEAP